MKRFLLIVLIITVSFISIYTVISVLYPIEYRELVVYNAEKSKIEPQLLFALIKTESNFHESALSHKGAKGLMQISDSTGAWGGEVLNIKGFNSEMLYDPKINIEIGSWYLNLLISQYKDINTALAAYNAGSGNVSRWLSDKNYSSNGITLDVIPFPETDSYVKKVVRNYDVYSNFYGNRLLSEDNTFYSRIISSFRGKIMEIRRNNR